MNAISGYRLSMDLTENELMSLIFTLETGERGTITTDLLDRISSSIQPVLTVKPVVEGEE